MSRPVTTHLQTSATSTNLNRVADGVAPMRALIESLDWPAGSEWQSLKLSRAWAGRKGRITVEHTVRLVQEDASNVWAIQGFFDKRVHKIPDSSCTPRFVDGHLLGIHVADRKRGFCILSPDCDLELPVLRMFFDRDSLGQILTHEPLRRHFDRMGVINHDEVCASLISYRCHRRFVVRITGCNDAEDATYVKGMRRFPSPQLLKQVRDRIDVLRLRSDGLVRAPALVGVAPEWNLLCFEGAPTEAAPSGYVDFDIDRAAHVASLIHELPPSMEDRRHRPADELGTVSRWQPVLRFLRPDASNPLEQLVTTLRRYAPEADPVDYRVIHRDFYDAQILFDGSSVWLVDWDTVCLGHVELDIATYAAHAVLDDTMNARANGVRKDRLSAFLAEYTRWGGSYDATRLRWYAAGALTRLAAMYTARCYPQEVTDALWRSASDACLELERSARNVNDSL